jgi:KUP system potassium uptake protein
VPQVNWALMVSTIVIVIGFESSSALAAAYGIAVTLTMVITAVLLHVIAPRAMAVGEAPRLLRDCRLPDNRPHVFRRQPAEGVPGWMAAPVDRRGVFTLMTTWKTGRGSSPSG